MKPVFSGLVLLLALIIISCGKKVKDIEANVLCGSMVNPQPINPYKNANGEYIVFVSMFGCGKGDGSSWFDATSVEFLRNIVPATSNLPAGVKISKVYLKTGNYKPTDNRENVSAAFTTPNANVVADSTYGVEFIGGFRGNSIDASSADPVKYPTYFCGRPESKSILDDCSDGESLTRLVNTDKSASFRNIIFKGARTSSFGGAISGKNLFLYNTRFENNYSGTYGGAVEAGLLVKIYNSNFQDNTSTYGGAIHQTGFFPAPNLWITNSSFLRNQALSSDGRGGVVYSSGSAILINSTLEDNYAFNIGDAINTSYLLSINSNIIGHPGNPSITLYNTTGLTVFFNSIFYDNNNAKFISLPTFYNSIVRGGYSAADATHNVINADPNLLSLTQIFDATRSYYYRPIALNSIARNAGVRVWVKNVDFPLSAPVYFKDNTGNYYKISCGGGGSCLNNQTLVNESELLALPDYIEPGKQDINGRSRNDNMPDIGTYEFDSILGF